MRSVVVVVVDPVADHEAGFSRGDQDFVVELLGAWFVVQVST